MRYALAVRRRRRRALERARRDKAVRYLERTMAAALRPLIGRRRDPAADLEATERAWCAINGIAYEAIVPGSVRGYTAQLREPLHRVTIEAVIDV